VGENALQQKIKRGTHGREIRSIALQPIPGELLFASGSEDTFINFTQGIPRKNLFKIVRNDELIPVYRKKQFNTGIQALAFSQDGNVMFTSAGQKEVSVLPLRVAGRDIISVEFGGFSSNSIDQEDKFERDEDLGGDLRIMSIDVRKQKVEDIDGYLICVVLSDSTVKVLT
jgi:hypothetical protein